MEILPKRIYEILKNKGVSSIYHANSVMASCSMLRNRSLLSPGSADKHGLFHSAQTSAQLGRNFGIWDDVFTHATDIHRLTAAPNSRGPVLFELDVELIRNTSTGRAWVTKSDPAGWELNTPHERRWFATANDLDHYFSGDNAGHMAVFRHCAGKLPLLSHLRRIILDDPQQRVAGEVDCFSMAYGALRLAMSDGGIQVPIERRACETDCGCHNLYREDGDRTERMFSPHLV